MQRSKASPAPEGALDEVVETNSGVKVNTWQLFEPGGERRVYLQSEARKLTDDRILHDQRAKFGAALEALNAGLSNPGYIKDYEKVLVKAGRLVERHSRVSHQYKVRVRRKKGTSHAEAVTCT